MPGCCLLLPAAAACVPRPPQALRRVYGAKVPEPVAVKVTQWASDEYSRGSYSYVAVGCTGQEYDTLALPVSRCVLFAGEHTCKEHPDSVGGAMLSGLREASRALQLLRGPAGADAAALVASRTQTLSKTDKRKRMEGEEGRWRYCCCKHGFESSTQCFKPLL
jgi:lysine-specific histone demethylase 1